MTDWTGTFDFTGGKLGWNAYTQAYGTTSRPAMEIELFLKEYSVPVRKKQLTEINTVDLYDPHNEMANNVQAIIEGSPELNTVTLGGYMKTPINSSGRYEPYDKDGSPVAAYLNVTFAEIVGMYIEGRLDLTLGMAYQRRDPDYFIDPHGKKYISPVIDTWEISAAAEFPQRQNISGTLLLER